MAHSLSPDKTVRELFLSACQDLDLKTVENLLGLGADVNWGDEHGGTLKTGLHYAAAKWRFLGADRLLDLLLAQPGVDVNSKDRSLMTPLILACLHGREKMVLRLLQTGRIELNCADESGWTAIHYAVLWDHSACLEVLRGATGLDWNVRDRRGRSPLLLAAGLGRVDAMEWFLSLPHELLDLTESDRDGKNCTWLAVENKGLLADPLGCVQLLSQDCRVDWNTRNKTGDTPLMYCLKNNKTEMAKILLNNPRVDIHTMNMDGKYPENIARLVSSSVKDVIL